MKLLNLSVIILASICSTVALAVGPPKLTDLGPQPFQIVLSAEWSEANGNLTSLTAASDPFVLEEDKTALLNYVSCRSYRFFGGGSNDATFRLTAEVDGGSLGEVTILFGELELETSFFPSPPRESSADVISACIGKNCNSLGNGAYVSLVLKAERNSGSSDTESVDCLISGTMY